MTDCVKFQEAISALIDGELTESEKAEALVHIGACDDCRIVYDAFLTLSAGLGGMSEEPPAELLSGVMSSIEGQKPKSAGGGAVRPWNWYLRYAGVAACLVVVISLAAIFALSPRGGSSAPPMYMTGGSASKAQDSASLMENGASAENYAASEEASSATAAPEAAPAPAGENQYIQDISEAELYGSVARGGEAPYSATIFDVNSGENVFFVDSDDVEALNTIIGFSFEIEFDALDSSRDPDYTVTIGYFVEYYVERRTFEIWLDGESLICRESSGETYVAAGSAARLRALLG